MKIVFFLIVFNCLLAKVSAECADSCECPEFSSLRRSDADGFQFTQLAGCTANATCLNPNTFHMGALFQESQIPQPPESLNEFRIVTSGRNSTIPASSSDVFSYFGAVCENGSWYATKYPTGIAYFDTNGRLTYTDYDESYDGKKSRILGFYC